MCDSLYVSSKRSENGRHILAKVGDRPSAECQPLFYEPATDHIPGENVICTRISIPQVAHTNAILANKVWWMWGVEMGVNDHMVSVTINAEHSVFPKTFESGLLGNDLVRLALERGTTAYEAMHIVTSLLEKYGQEGQTHFEADGGRYESAYFFADTKEAWKLETAGREWIAKRCEDTDCIGNCYGIQTEYDEISAGLIPFAYENGLADPKTPFSFAEAYTDPSHLFLRASLRMRRVRELLNKAPEKINRLYIRRIFADHYEGTELEMRENLFTAIYPCVCMHSHTQGNAKTDCCMIFEYTARIGVVSWTAFSNSCASVYLPAYFTDGLPSLMTAASQYYSDDSLWWTMEKLCAEIEMDYKNNILKARNILDPLQKQIDFESIEREVQAARLLDAGKKEEAYALLNRFMDSNAKHLKKAAEKLIEEFSFVRKKNGGPFGPRNRKMMPLWEKMGMLN